MTPVKLGIIGCGIAARELHWPALREMADRFTITAVCNHTEPKARTFAEMVGGVPYLLDYRELLRRADVEAVLIALPIELNYPVTRDALRAGKHVLVEKPLAKNLTQAGRMVRFPEQFPTVAMVAENFRYRSTLARVSEMLNAGEIGQPYAAVWNLLIKMDVDNPYARTRWRIHHQYPGGFVTDGGVHYVAGLRELFDEITAGSAFTATVNPRIGEVDTFGLQFQTTSGVQGQLNLFFSATGWREDQLRIFGSRGSLVVEGSKITVKRSGSVDRSEEVPDDGGYRNEWEAFYRAIREGETVKSNFWQAYRDLHILLKALHAASGNRRMRF